MSMIISFVSQKGGVGKSTLARALGVEAARNALSVKIADLDVQQGTSVNWLRRRLAAGFEPHLSVESFKTAAQAIKESEKYELLIIDGPARASEATLEIARNSTLVMQPTGASIDDLEPAILTFYELVKKGVPAERLRLALTRVGTEAEISACQTYVSKTGFKILDGCLLEKTSYRQAQNIGKSVCETPYKKLNEQADTLVQSIIDATG